MVPGGRLGCRSELRAAGALRFMGLFGYVGCSGWVLFDGFESRLSRALYALLRCHAVHISQSWYIRVRECHYGSV